MDHITFENGDSAMQGLLSDIMNELIDDVTLGLCFEVHRGCKMGTLFLSDTDPRSEKEYEIVDRQGVDVFGQVPTKKQFECECPECHRNMAASRFAPHLEKCMGMGRNSSRIASRRQAKIAKENELRLAAAGVKLRDSDDSPDDDNDIDWSYDVDKKIKKLKKDKLSNSPRRNKSSKLLKNGDTASDRSGTPEPSIPTYELMSIDERKELLRHTCGVISEHTKKMCTRSHRCPQHTDEQRIQVRQFLLCESDVIEDDVHIDIDGYDDAESHVIKDSLQWDISSSPSATDIVSSNSSNSKRKLMSKSVSSKSLQKKKKMVKSGSNNSLHSGRDGVLSNSSLYDFE